MAAFLFARALHLTNFRRGIYDVATSEEDLRQLHEVLLPHEELEVVRGPGDADRLMLPVNHDRLWAEVQGCSNTDLDFFVEWFEISLRAPIAIVGEWLDEAWPGPKPVSTRSEPSSPGGAARRAA